MLKIQDFEFVKVVGVGAFGKVHLVRLKSSPTSVFAMKMLDFGEILRQRLADQLENEISILKRIYGCPFVAKLYSTDFHGGKVGLIMEYVGGGELFYWLKKCGRFDEQMARFYAAEIISALRFIHGRGILYRDLKPENILITSTGHIKLIDFGFSVYESENIYMISGTPEYMSPEKLRSEDDGRASDYWGLGVMIYEMLCGDPPFYDSSADAIYHKILESNVVFPHYVSPVARCLITGLLDKNRATRLGTKGICEIMGHPFFKGIDWHEVESRRIEPPFIPNPNTVLSSLASSGELKGTDDAETVVLKPYKHIKHLYKVSKGL
ncbi:cAMP-DEPENDENT SER/THR PROTEIN KINASE (ALPHA SUBUNIT) [Encephalitozoon cuniculi GB-M1]|uniref:Probable cAMP-dependent protein kinase catalytic subunit n=2 Tax=Encephalitozoon cuniculi TaxID=6035 RepID=KAPC_ENCCU|nr:serine/threonine kinase [Encephalitozoon cuniculi GB-M1]Q8SRK8.1 RecName: Full=Probable cAMP-dependent protein kinase catalytic subunit [Encephalitozoon cuniculi GB-M1]AGE96366.1 camp-dependent ser/thr protein kinase [Encephalitozoon cuniculi]KMV65776.1 serine/threonine kinase [Encephalitozoon cuniculi EcunIII-L]CAD25584.1 cAMP-DEPENDENT SER/THR PROTEIN KINASE (ALPHA SUBUNIT) [Encephalitozoon cuniculi GB-M1]